MAVTLALILPMPAAGQSTEPLPTIVYNEFHRGCLDSPTPDGRAEPRPCDYSTDWVFEPIPGGLPGHKRIRSIEFRDRCLEAGEESILIRPCNNGLWQQWSIEYYAPRPPDAWNRGIRIRSARNPANCIDNYKSSAVRLWQCAGSYQQQWNISLAAFERL